MTKLSIITVNFNNKDGLQKTIESVLSQTFKDYEYIVIDGGSTDGSIDVINRYSDRITRWISEPDKGVYHAMNKGILQAKGEYCQFLNSGDWLIQPYGLQHVFDMSPIEDIIYCDEQSETDIWACADQLTYLTFFEHSIPHQAAFIKRALFSTIGLYNEENKIVSDWEFYIKAIIRSQCSYRHIPFLLVFFDGSGISENPLFQELLYKEREKTLKEMYPMMYNDYRQLISLKQELSFYRLSRLLQYVIKIQQTRFYQILDQTKKSIYHFRRTIFHQTLNKIGLKIRIFHSLAFFHAKKLPLNADRYLIIAPHPDDEVFGCAGLIYRLNQSGKKVHVVILTQGEAVQDEPKTDIQTIVAKRREMALDAAKIMGLTTGQYTFLDWGDDKVRENHINESKLKELTSIIETIKPEVIFTPHIADVHQDHIHTAKIVNNMISPSIKQIYYCVWIWYQSCKPQWNKSYVLKMNKKERLVKRKAMDAYVLPVDEYGVPYSGDLRELASISGWRKELFFEAQ